MLLSKSKSRHDTWRILSLTIGILVVSRSAAHADFVPISQPDATYLANTSLAPIATADFDLVSSLTAEGVTVTPDIGLVALTVPTTWGSWGSPPDVESSTPRVLWTNGATSLTLMLSHEVQIFGVEAQPNTTVVSSILASFYQGANLVGEIALDVDGNGGAHLFAASSSTRFDKIVFASTDDFAIAQVRLAVPEPSSLTMLVLGSVGIGVAALARRRTRPARPCRPTPPDAAATQFAD
jgi:hypothetical protein